jgi:flagella basal body P-ring formation protein FlgA
LAVFDLLANCPLGLRADSGNERPSSRVHHLYLDISKRLGQGLCLLALGLNPLGAQTLNAVQLASLGRDTDSAGLGSKTFSGQLQLQYEARNWLAQQLALNTDQVRIADMDARLMVVPCQGGTFFDHPFANRQVIRARCENPSWQYFLKASFADEQAALKASKVSIPLATTKAVVHSTPNMPKVETKPNVSISPVQATSSSKIKTVLVANQPLRRGTVLQASFFKQVELPIASTDAMVLSQFKEIENTELLHDMGVDQAIRNYDVKPTLLVKRGQQVNFSVGEGRGFLIIVKTEAQQDGSLGDQIKLKNVESGRLISGVITGLNEARAL